MKSPAQLRAALIGKVHVLAKRLGFDEATYRTVLLTQTGKTSCKEMNDRQLSRLAEALEYLSKGKPCPTPGNRPKPLQAVLSGRCCPRPSSGRRWRASPAGLDGTAWKISACSPSPGIRPKWRSSPNSPAPR